MLKARNELKTNADGSSKVRTVCDQCGRFIGESTVVRTAFNTMTNVYCSSCKGLVPLHVEYTPREF